MCGRYVTVSQLKVIEKRFNVVASAPENYIQRVNIGPGSKAPVITDEAPGALNFFQFGLTPFWAKKKMYQFNARSEGDQNKDDDPHYSGAKGIIQKPMFRHAIRKQRCLVPADAFIEGPKKERLNKPYVVYANNIDRPFAFAGIWDRWVNKDTGEEVDSFAIITTAAYGVLHKIGHHRGPVILSPEDEHHWLNRDLPLGEVTELLRPSEFIKLNAYPIDTDIKNPTAEGSDLLAPIGERLIKEYDYKFYNTLKLEGMGHTRGRQRKLDFD